MLYTVTTRHYATGSGTRTVSNERCTALGILLYVAAQGSALYQAAERAVQCASDSNLRARVKQDTHSRTVDFGAF